MPENDIPGGPLNEGPVNEGPRNEGPVDEGAVNEGPVSEGPVNEGPVDERADTADTVRHPVLPPEPVAGPATPRSEQPRFRDRVWGFRAMIAVALAGLILGGAVGAGIAAAAGDDDDVRGPGLRRHPGMQVPPGWRRRGPRWDGPQMPGMPGPGQGQGPGGHWQWVPNGGGTPSPLPTPTPSPKKPSPNAG